MSKVDDFISRKMEAMKDEDKPQKQKLAIAFSYAKKKLFKKKSGGESRGTK